MSDITPRAPPAPSGRFLLRLPPGLHALLRRAAAAAGLSLNEFCVRRLSSPGEAPGAAAEAVRRAAEQFGDALAGVVLFGSLARGEAGDGSDADLLLVLGGDVPLRRDLYRRWDEEPPLRWDGRRVEPHFVHLPPPDRTPAGLWAEVALDGIVLFARDPGIPRLLCRVRRAILEGRIVRRVVHGQPYWVEAA